MSSLRWSSAFLALPLLLAACSADNVEASDAGAERQEISAAGVRWVSPEQGGDILADSSPELVVLDVRTEEEFAGERLDGAVMIDFYRDDFADQLAELDRDVPYLLYCRSGNRSGQAAQLMEELGFSDVANVEGGIVSWIDTGLPVVGG